MIQARKLVLGGVAAVAAVMVLASTASACVQFLGDLTLITPDSTNRVTGSGTGGAMNYCVNRHPATAGSAGAGDTITISVGLATACISTTNKLPQGDARVLLTNSEADSTSPFVYSSGAWRIDSAHASHLCGMGQTDNVVLSTAFNVNVLGAGSGSFTVPHLKRVDPQNYASGICVANGSVGIAAPIRITSI